MKISDGLRRCCVTSPGSPLLIGGLGFFVGTWKLLNAFKWCLQPDGNAVVQRDQLPVLQRASKSRPVLKALLFILSGTSLDMPTAAVPIRLFLWGGATPMSFGTYQIYSVIFHVMNNQSFNTSIMCYHMLNPFIISPNCLHH